MPERIVIIGGVAAGASAAAKARRTSESAQITLVERGPDISFANCGLPYYLGGVIDKREALLVYTPERFAARFQVELRLRTEARQVDTRNRRVWVSGPAGEENLAYDKLILATGARPAVPPIPGLAEVRSFPVRTVPDVDAIKEYIARQAPRTAVIIGGGYIGVELAEALVHCGLRTSVVEAEQRILPGFPAEMTLNIGRAMKKAGVQVLTDALVTRIAREDGIARLTLRGGQSLAADMLFLATGVSPDAALAQAAGLGLGEWGGVRVNERMETSLPDIYAAGDLVEKRDRLTGKHRLLALAGPANREGRVAGCNAAGGDLRFPGVIGTVIVGFGEQCAARTGLSLEGARAAGFDAACTFTENAHHADYYPNARYIFLQLVYEKGSGRILGAAGSGSRGVARRIDVLATAIQAGLGVRDLEDLELCYAPPYGAAKDGVNMAGFVASNQLRGTGFGITPRDFLLQPGRGVPRTLLDVRSPAEFRAGALEGAVHIPIDELRGRLGELDPGRPVEVYCAVGYRGYLAARILRQHGFEATNIMGGIFAVRRFQALR